MTKREAIEKFVENNFKPIPTEWVRKVAESEGECPALPMWGTMWFVEAFGDEITARTRVMVSSASEIERENCDSDEEWERVQKAIGERGHRALERYIDEDMARERCVLDRDGNPTAAYVYEIDGRTLIGVNGAGWDFYEGVWDVLYDLCGLEWHDREESCENHSSYREDCGECRRVGGDKQ